MCSKIDSKICKENSLSVFNILLQMFYWAVVKHKIVEILPDCRIYPSEIMIRILNHYLSKGLHNVCVEKDTPTINMGYDYLYETIITIHHKTKISETNANNISTG